MTVKTRNGHSDTAVASELYALLPAHFFIPLFSASGPATSSSAGLFRKSKFLAIILLLLALSITMAHGGRCSGSSGCGACKTCSSCRYCNQGGGTCGVCQPSSVYHNSTTKSHGSGGLSGWLCVLIPLALIATPFIMNQVKSKG